MPVDMMRNMLVGLLAIPLAAAIVVALLGGKRPAAVRSIGLGATVVTALLAFVLAFNFASMRSHEGELATGSGRTTATFRPEFVPGAPRGSDEHATSWNLVRFGSKPLDPAIQFYVGIDGLNVWLVVLTTVLMVSAVLVSWNSIQDRVHEFFAWLSILELGMIGVFLAFDIILFYVFFELTLVPLFFLIGIWGGPQRRYAARKFFVYTLAGSVITLLGVLGIVLACYNDKNIQELTFSIPRLVFLVNERLHRLHLNPIAFAADLTYWNNIQFWVFLALIAGFSIKVPLVPLHTWLPLAHVEAPTAGSVLLAGVLLKIGSYGYLRLCLPLAPSASLSVGVPMVGTLAVIGIVYGSFCALAQSDIKKLVAYSSVSHLGFCMLGIFALNTAGLSGGVLQMINHGLSTGGLFLLVGMLYERYHTRLLSDYGGMGSRLPVLSLCMVFICLTSIGLPGLNGFVGEVLVLMGIFDFQWSQGQFPILAVVGATGIVLGAWYLLSMLLRVFFGLLKEPHFHSEDHGPVQDLSFRELAVPAPILILCVVIGVYPQGLLNSMKNDVEVVSRLVNPARRNTHEITRSEPIRIFRTAKKEQMP